MAKKPQKPKPFKKALPITEFCPGCGRSSQMAKCNQTLKHRRILSRGRSYIANVSGNERYQQVKRTRKYLPKTLK